jgi:23S rRNA (cytosine1962-C5)-methyltransferase
MPSPVSDRTSPAVAVVSRRGASRWDAGHPWIFRSDVVTPPDAPAGAVTVHDQRGKPLGTALWSPASEISLRLVDRDPHARLDAAWWTERIGAAIARRGALRDVTTAWRVVHGEGDALPSLVVDAYDRYVVVQLMSAGVVGWRRTVIRSSRR